MAKQKKQNSKIIDTILKFYTPIVVVLLFGIMGSWFLYSSYAATSTAVAHDQALRIIDARSARGLPQYKHIECLNDLAEDWSAKMAKYNKLYHNPSLASSVTSRCGSGWTYVGENVGYGANSSSIFTAFMNSAPHKANILDRDYNRMGIGAYWGPGGKLWVTQVYAKCSSNCSSGQWASPVQY